MGDAGFGMTTVAEKLASLPLPPAPKPIGVYKPFQRCGDMVYLSGHGPVQLDGSLIKGRVGSAGMDIEGGFQAARQVPCSDLTDTGGVDACYLVGV